MCSQSRTKQKIFCRRIEALERWIIMTKVEQWKQGLIAFNEGVVNHELLEVAIRWFTNCIEVNNTMNCFDMEELTHKFMQIITNSCIDYDFINGLQK